MSGTNVALNTITVNGVDYMRADLVPAPIIGNRVVIVVDRGWIFAGDATVDPATNQIQLDRAVGVRRWEGVGFNGMIADPTKKVLLEVMTRPVVIPANSVIFTVPVDANWGL